MARGLLILTLFLFSGEVTGLNAFLEEAIDQQMCLDDGPDCHCPPGCTCACCSHSARPLISLPELAALIPLTEESAPPCVERAPPSTDPDDILHVPRLGLL